MRDKLLRVVGFEKDGKRNPISKSHWNKYVGE